MEEKEENNQDEIRPFTFSKYFFADIFPLADTRSSEVAAVLVNVIKFKRKT